MGLTTYSPASEESSHPGMTSARAMYSLPPVVAKELAAEHMAMDSAFDTSAKQARSGRRKGVGLRGRGV